MNKSGFYDETLGHLQYDESFGDYKGEIKIKDSLIKLNLAADEDGLPVLERAKQILSNFDKYAESAKEYAVKQLLQLKNESWLGEDEKSLNAEQFKSLMSLRSIVFDEVGEVTFYHDDGDLFWGHTIEIGMNSDDEFYHADIPG